MTASAADGNYRASPEFFSNLLSRAAAAEKSIPTLSRKDEINPRATLFPFNSH
jgi:hypothetical protein